MNVLRDRPIKSGFFISSLPGSSILLFSRMDCVARDYKHVPLLNTIASSTAL